MYYTASFALSLLVFSFLSLFSIQTALARACPIRLETRLQLQLFQESLKVWEQLPLAFWQGFQPDHFYLEMPESECIWGSGRVNLPEMAEKLPDFEGLFLLPEDFQLAPQASTEPLFCKPFGRAFQNWLLERQPRLAPSEDAIFTQGIYQSPGNWLPEMRALQKALNSSQIEPRRDWIRVFLAARALRFAGKETERNHEEKQELLLGLRFWLCDQIQMAAQAHELPEEIKYLNPFQNPLQIHEQLTADALLLSEAERLAHLGRLQVALIQAEIPDWQKAIEETGRTPQALLTDFSQFSPLQIKHYIPRIAALNPSLNFLPQAVRFSAQDGFLIQIELRPQELELRPLALVSLNAHQTLLLPGSEVKILHPLLTGLLRGKTQITQLENGRVQLAFYLTLRSQLKLKRREDGCAELEINTPHFNLRGGCLWGKETLRGYTLDLP